MPVTMSDVLRRLLDNANLGKAVADVGPGLALSVPLLMLIALMTGMSVLPADRLKTLDSQIQAAREEVLAARAGFKDLLSAVVAADVAASCDAGSETAALKANRCYAQALRTIADLGADVEAHAAAMKEPAKYKAELDRLTPIRKANDRLLAHKESHDAAVARLQTLENQKIDAESLQYNLITFTDNLSAFIAFAVILGILLSQLTHWAIVELTYKRARAVIDAEKTPISIAQILSRQDEELVTNYFRYTEGAINMIVPVLLLGFIFPAYATERLPYAVNGWAFRIGGVLVAAALGYAGYLTYLNFVRKRRDLALDVAAGRVALVSKI
jgi:hypothetical protein